MKKGKCLIPIILSAFLMSCAPLVLFGAGTAAGVAGYKYYHGALTVIYQASYMETWEASLKALEDMNIKIQEKSHDLTVGNIKAQRADKTPVLMTVKYKSSQETTVVIRAGWLGDKTASIAIKEAIRKTLFKG